MKQASLVNVNEVKAAIRSVHKHYYNAESLNDLLGLKCFHQSLEVLFNFAGIDETLKENNPDMIAISDLEAQGYFDKEKDETET